MQKHKLITPILALVMALSSCSRQAVLGNTTSLEGLKEMGYSSAGKQAAERHKNIRITAIKETALSLGAQSGLAASAKEINAQLTIQDAKLRKIFDFNALILNQNVLPPVLLQGRNDLNLASDHAIRIADRAYRIAAQARFVTTPPTWRQYIWMDYKVPDRPDITLLPKNKEEKEIWDKYVTLGWNQGLGQASSIFANNIARLKQDFRGMLLYRELLAQNMVSPPYVAKTELGVTGDGNHIRIDDQVLRITALPQLNPNSNQWIPAVSKDKDALKKFRRMDKLARKPEIVITDKAWQPVIPKNFHEQT